MSCGSFSGHAAAVAWTSGPRPSTPTEQNVDTMPRPERPHKHSPRSRKTLRAMGVAFAAAGLAFLGTAPPAAAATPRVSEIALAEIDPTTPLYKLPLLLSLTDIQCPISVSASIGKISLPLVHTKADICGPGETAPDKAVIYLPVFDAATGAYALPDEVNNISVAVDGVSGAASVDMRIPPRPYWVGVGDSYSSGHHQDKSDLKSAACKIDILQGGAIFVVDQLKADNDACNTSPNDEAFSWVTKATDRLNEKLSVPEPWRMKPQVIARSGTAAQDFDKVQSEYDHGQSALMTSLLTEVSPSWNVVSVTGGADDGNYTFASALREYYKEAAGDSGFLGTGLGKRAPEPWKAKWPDCPNIEGIYQNVGRELPGIRASLQGLLERAHATSPGVRTVDLGYPYVLPTDHSCAQNHGSSHGATATIDLLDEMHLSIGHVGDHHVDSRGLLAFDDLQKTLYLGYPHAGQSGQDKVAEAAVAALT